LGPREADTWLFPVRGLAQRQPRVWFDDNSRRQWKRRWHGRSVFSRSGQRTPPPVCEQAPPPFPPFPGAHQWLSCAARRILGDL